MEDQTYVVGAALQALTLPEATGGNGALTYSLGPMIPDGLTFDASTRTLSGTPTTAGTYDMTYTVKDGDDNTNASDAATQTFTITVQPAYVGTWHFADVPSPTTLTFGVDTFTLTVGDGINPLIGSDGEKSPITRITVTGTYYGAGHHHIHLDGGGVRRGGGLGVRARHRGRTTIRRNSGD